MPLDDKINALTAANVSAQNAFVQAVGPARDAYVQQRVAFRDVEDRWLADVANDEARQAARDGWQQLTAARKAFSDAANTAATARDASVAAAWADIRSR